MIKVLIMDIDGVLTDGKLTIDSSGNEYKTIDYRDVDAIFEIKRRGLKLAMVTGEASAITGVIKERFQPDFFYAGCKEKTKVVEEIHAQTGAGINEICYIGDGKYDVAAMKSVGFAACPANALPEVKAAASIRLKCKGGDGCLLELLKWIEKHGS
jgi:YrbI family 3-deoxy-D-manno-octulosonate 8-phosphate phosphatase